MTIQILPVIHHIDVGTSLTQAAIAHHHGADGVFLISHHGEDLQLPRLGAVIKDRWGFKVGINLLTLGVEVAHRQALANKLDMVWADRCGVSSAGLDATGLVMNAAARRHPEIEIFASVAFKYQPEERDPEAAAMLALQAGFIPTTSGPATGQPPEVSKIVSMSAAADGRLAIASGMSMGNIARFAPHLSHVLVSTGVSLDEHHLDEVRLEHFVKRARSAAAAHPAEVRPC